MKAALYARYSTELQREASCEDQFRECRRAAAGAGLDVVAEFSDKGISGRTAERPGYQDMLAAARRGDFEVIVVEDISRLWRNRAEYGARSAEFEDLGVHCLTCVGDDTRRDGWGLVIGIKQTIAEHYRREISHRTRRGMEGLALAGKSTGGRCYGYTAAGDVDPEQAEVVRRMFEMAATGHSQYCIAAQLNYEGRPSPRGGVWRQSTVGAILANPRYAGRVVWGKTVGRRSAVDSRKVSRVLRSEGPRVDRDAPELRIIGGRNV